MFNARYSSKTPASGFRYSGLCSDVYRLGFGNGGLNRERWPAAQGELAREGLPDEDDRDGTKFYRKLAVRKSVVNAHCPPKPCASVCDQIEFG